MIKDIHFTKRLRVSQQFLDLAERIAQNIGRYTFNAPGRVYVLENGGSSKAAIQFIKYEGLRAQIRYIARSDVFKTLEAIHTDLSYKMLPSEAAEIILNS